MRYLLALDQGTNRRAHGLAGDGRGGASPGLSALLFNIHTLAWDEELLRLFEIPRSLLPEVRPSAHVFGETEAGLLDAPIPIGGLAGDQQAATFGQACFEPGMVKNTYGPARCTLRGAETSGRWARLRALELQAGHL